MFVKDPARLRRRRKAKGFSQAQLAALCGCTQQYISLIEGGTDRDCSEKIAGKITRWLDCDLEDLFDERQSIRGGSITSDLPADGNAA